MRGFGLMGAARVVRLLLSDDLPDLVLGSRCVGCDRPGRAMCAVCGMGLAGPARPAAPKPAPEGLPLVWATAGYGGVVRAALIAHKERGRVTLAGPLGAALAMSIEAAATTTPCLPATSDASAAAGDAARAATAALARRDTHTSTGTPGPRCTTATPGIGISSDTAAAPDVSGTP